MYWNELIGYTVPLCVMMVVWLRYKNFDTYFMFSWVFSVINVIYAYIIYFHDVVNSLIHAGGLHPLDWMIALYTIIIVCGIIYGCTASVLIGLSYLVYRLRNGRFPKQDV